MGEEEGWGWAGGGGGGGGGGEHILSVQTSILSDISFLIWSYTARLGGMNASFEVAIAAM